MGTTYPPDGWTITSGTWGTDADVDTSVRLTGDASIKFLDTTPAADTTIISEAVPCEVGQPMICDVWLRASSIAAGNTVSAWIFWLDSSKGYVNNTPIHGGLLNASDTWELKSAIGTAPATTCYAIVAIAKNKTAFNSWVDSVSLRRFPKAFRAYRQNGQSAAAGDYLSLNGGEEYDHGNWFDGTDTATIPTTGIYTFSAGAIGDLLDADEYFLIVLRKESGGAYSDVFYGSLATSRTANLNDSATSVLSYTGLFTAGDTVKVQIQHSHAGDGGALGIIAATFSGNQSV